MLRRAAAVCLGSLHSSLGTAWPSSQAAVTCKASTALQLSFSSITEPDSESNPAPSDKVVKLASEIENLSIKEVVWLNKLLKENMGISDADLGMGMAMGMAPLAGAPPADGSEGAAEAVEEKTSFNVIVDGFDASAKIKIIKEIRSVLPDLGLKEAKALVDKVPATIKSGIPKAEAEELQKKLTAVGAQVALQ